MLLAKFWFSWPKTFVELELLVVRAPKDGVDAELAVLPKKLVDGAVAAGAETGAGEPNVNGDCVVVFGSSKTELAEEFVEFVLAPNIPVGVVELPKVNFGG